MRVILFDGVCQLCDGAVQFIMKRDGGVFHFASLQSEVGQRYIEQYGFGTDSVVLIEDGRVYSESAAALRIARQLAKPWSFLYALLIVPRPVRDAVYRIIARNRYRLFGQRETCALPTKEEHARFLS